MFSRLCAPSCATPQAEIARCDRRAGGHQHAALDRVLELAHVARPRMPQQRVHGRVVEARQILPIPPRMLLEKVERERRNVVTPIAQRRQHDFNRVETEQQVLPEAAGGHFGIDVGVRRRKNAHVDAARARRAEPLELAGGDHAQQLGLLRRRHIRDFVEEERAAIGQLESSHAIARASVNAPRTCPNSSLSNTVSDTPPALTVTIGRDARGDSA